MIKSLLTATALMMIAQVQSATPAFAFEPDCRFNWRVNSINSTREVNNGRISVRKGKSCLTRHIGWVNGVWTYHGLSIKTQPEHARIQRVGRVGLRVIADDDFTGRDNAEIVISFQHSRTKQIVKTVVRTRVSVNR